VFSRLGITWTTGPFQKADGASLSHLVFGA
jgi:hypothetical protein